MLISRRKTAPPVAGRDTSSVARVFAGNFAAEVFAICVDTPEQIEAFLPNLDEMIGEGLVTLEKVQVITYRYHE
ncbi:MAG: hypothetical protein DWQ37_17230 [Planctomycetota bacterium]|nr:MAG: hypothetical protein DWQ37_17230 [Planctomycetota bacterium]